MLIGLIHRAFSFSTWRSTCWLVKSSLNPCLSHVKRGETIIFFRCFLGETRAPDAQRFQGRLRAKHHEGGAGRRGDYLQREGGDFFWYLQMGASMAMGYPKMDGLEWRIVLKWMI